MVYYSPKCAWNVVDKRAFWLIDKLDPDSGFRVDSSLSAYQKGVTADALLVPLTVAKAKQVMMGEFATCLLKPLDEALFAARLATIGFVQRGIELRRAAAREAALREKVASLQSTVRKLKEQLPCPTAEPCPTCPVCKQPPPCPTCPECHDCPPCEQAPLVQQQQQPAVPTKPSWGANLGWLAGGAVVGAGGAWLLKARKR